MLEDHKDSKKYDSRKARRDNKIKVINGKPVNPYKKPVKRSCETIKGNKGKGTFNPYRNNNENSPVMKNSEMKKKLSESKIKTRCTESCYATYENMVCNFSINFYPSPKEVNGSKRIEVHSKNCYKFQD